MSANEEHILRALIEKIDSCEGLLREQLEQLTRLPSSELKEGIKYLFDECCIEVTRAPGKSVLDFYEVHILPEGVNKYATLLAEREAQYRQDVFFRELLHPIVIESSYQRFLDGHLRDAVLNSIIAVFDLIREKTGLDLDGDALATNVFSVDKPKLMLNDLQTVSGRNEQIGFMNMLQGAYKGIRNTKAHTMRHDLDENKAKQYLVFASLLARRVQESVKVNK